MSSHHIIREKQEPALLILGLDNFADELLGQLLEWSPTLMVTGHTAEKVNAMGIKFDIMVGGGDTGLQSDIKYVSPQGHSEIIAALQYLTANNYPAVNIVTDAFSMEDILPYAGEINIVVFYDGRKTYPVTTGFTKWKPAGETIALLSEPKNLSCTGLQATGRNIYQTLADGFFTLRFDSPYVFIAESIA